MAIGRREFLTAGSFGLLAIHGSAWSAVGAVNESGFVPIGGIEQWIAAQGQDAENPVILFLHGGPGEAESPFLKEFAPWEHEFTVVNWDQRGSGKTYGRYGSSTPGMDTAEHAIERMAQDAIEVTEYACRRLRKKKAILVGHSWGAVLGLHVIKREPERFFAFVGTGQPVSWQLTLQAQERWARQQASDRGDQATLRALDDAANLPISDLRRISAPRKYRLSDSDQKIVDVQGAFLGRPPFPKHGKAADWIAGIDFTVGKLEADAFSFDVRDLGHDFAVPLFVIQGREDHVVSFDAARAYVDEIRAPRKAFIPIDGGHYALFTNPVQFVGALRRYVRPLANA